MHSVAGPEILTGTWTKARTKNMMGPGLRLGPKYGGARTKDRDRDRDQEGDNDL